MSRSTRPRGRAALFLAALFLAVAATLVAPRAATSQVQVPQPLSGKLAFVATPPCRLVDTRNGPPLAAGEARSFNVAGTQGFTAQGGNAGGCAIPGYVAGSPQARAVALNVVAVGPQGPGHLVAWPSDQAEPLASILNYTAVPGLNIANGVIVPLAQDATPGADLRVRAAVSGTHVVIDAAGYFTTARRKFFLTTGGYTGANADSACGTGFHIASLWEIFDVTSLEYDFARGEGTDDRGGPPAGTNGWIRSGTAPSTSDLAGIGNCNDWTSSSVSHYGTGVRLEVVWAEGSPTPISPWVGGVFLCSSNPRVWCVED